MKGSLCNPSVNCLLILLMATHVAAETPLAAEQFEYSTQAVISDDVLTGARGVIGVNIVAGDSNAQINAHALSISVGQGVHTSSNIKTSQHVNYLEGPDSAVSLIEGNAFSNASGLISINHASGAGNAQLNDVAIGIAIGGVALTESELNLTVTGQPVSQLSQGAGVQHREAVIGEAAFDGASGVVQINQLAGSGNATSNNFGLSVSLGAED